MTFTPFPALWTDSIAADVPTGTLYKVVKVNPKNVKCIAADGGMWDVHYSRLRPATPEEQEQWKATQPEPTLDQIFRLGSVCRFKAGSPYAAKWGSTDLYVVIKEKAGDVTSIVKLGGDVQRRFFASVPEVNLELVSGEVTVTNV